MGKNIKLPIFGDLFFYGKPSKIVYSTPKGSRQATKNLKFENALSAGVCLCHS